MQSDDYLFMCEFREIVADYIQAIDRWEACFTTRLTGPNFFGQVQNPAELDNADNAFMEARARVNSMLLRAIDVTKSAGVPPTYQVLLSVALNYRQDPFNYEPLLNSRARLAVFDSLTQAISALEHGYRPVQHSHTVVQTKRGDQKSKEAPNWTDRSIGIAGLAAGIIYALVPEKNALVVSLSALAVAGCFGYLCVHAPYTNRRSVRFFAFLSVLVAVGLFSWYSWPKPKSLPSARIVFTNVASSRGFASDPKEGFFLNIYYQNKGATAATGLTTHTWLRLEDRALTNAELDVFAKQLLHAPQDEPNRKDELQPEDPVQFYTVRVKTQYTESDLRAVEEGKKALYVIVVARYTDVSVSKGQQAVTEFCAMYSGSFSLWKRCGNNRIYHTSSN